MGTAKSGLDANTMVPIGIGYEHHEIHGGSHYNVCNYQLNNAVDDEIAFVITTPASGPQVHLTFEVYSSLGATVDLYEGSTSVVGGTAVTPRNNNRNSSNVSGSAIVKDPTSLTDGTFAAGYIAGSSRNAGATKREDEYVLAENTSYLIRITSLANSNNISWCADWYEHTPKG